jgi:hypothetical protein
MEREKKASLRIQTDADEYMYPGMDVRFSGNALLFYFGIFYTFVVVTAMFF